MTAKGTGADAHPAAPAGSADDAPVESDDPGEEPAGDGGAGGNPPDAPPPAPVPALTKAQKRDFHAGARSVHHLLTHRPKNPHCHACTV
eukprot:9402337-Alexandrium_andersonii.AAC.1